MAIGDSIRKTRILTQYDRVTPDTTSYLKDKVEVAKISDTYQEYYSYINDNVYTPSLTLADGFKIYDLSQFGTFDLIEVMAYWSVTNQTDSVTQFDLAPFKLWFNVTIAGDELTVPFETYKGLVRLPSRTITSIGLKHVDLNYFTPVHIADNKMTVIVKGYKI